MCGIFAILNYYSNAEKIRSKAITLSKLLRHRGPDWSGTIISGNNILCHERLSIVGVDSGSQPLTNQDNSIILTVNGEIYNHAELKKYIKHDVVFKTHSDCEIILHLYEELGPSMVNLLKGMFSFVLFDARQNRYICARDPIGITTLYRGRNLSNPQTIYYASEMKALQEDCNEIEYFPPGHIYDSLTGETTRYFSPSWWSIERIPKQQSDLTRLRDALETAVHRRLMSEVPFGVLLSGGLDSSLIASITVREAEKAFLCPDEDDGSAVFQWPKVHSFSIGLPGSPDLKAAKEVADFIGSKHHSFQFTIQEALDALPDVIYHLETFDVTTIRASTPMYLLSRRIKAMGVKMVLSGEGSDEIFAGYLYFHKAPNAAELHKECLARVKNLHLADCLRANKSTMAWGLEARVPFLDTDFLEVAMNINPEEKEIRPDIGRMEKHVLRQAFNDLDNPYLPHHILWRQKEQFSDGVGYNWIDSLKNTAEMKVSDELFATRHKRWSVDTPDTKEAFWYRCMFDDVFPNAVCETTVERWIPRKDWGCSTDPSGRAQDIHTETIMK